jgi:hypothetical protein
MLVLINYLKRKILMKNKPILAISAFVTVLIITVGVGVITKVYAKSSLDNTSPTLDATAFAQREQAYQQIINEANQEIEQANQQIATLSGQTFQSPIIQPTSEFLFNSEHAVQIAEQITGIAPSVLPELVIFSGDPAYEVVYANGNIYIDANTGSVLYNGLQVQQTQLITSDQALYIAASYLPGSQPITLSTSTFNGANVYIVGFSDGQSVYIDMSGTIVAVQMAAPAQPSAVNSDSDDDHDDESSESDDN